MNPDELPTEFPDPSFKRMAMPENCLHETILMMADGWHCENCNLPFVPAEVAQELEAGLEIAAAQIALVMVQYTERMTERYGPLQEDEDQCKDGHSRNPQGVCVNCGDNPFLGGGK